MKKLFISRSDLQKEQLILKDNSGEEFYLPLSDDVRTAVYQVDAKELTKTALTLSPKDIQRKIRAGISPVELTKQTEMSLEEINRFALPIQGEKKIAIRQFRAARLDKSKPFQPLESVMARILASDNISLNDLTWEAVRLDNNPWRVSAHYSFNGQTLDGVWLWDPESSKIEPIGGESYRLIGLDTESIEPVIESPEKSQESKTYTFSEEIKTEYSKMFPQLTPNQSVAQPVKSMTSTDTAEEFSKNTQEQRASVSSLSSAQPQVEPEPLSASAKTVQDQERMFEPAADSLSESNSSIVQQPSLSTQSQSAEPVVQLENPVFMPSAVESTTKAKEEDFSTEIISTPQIQEPTSKSSRIKVPSWDEILTG
ncbi:MAG: DUF3071 domain-containing protein [Bifidobacteriaceae bacterium]|jgi:hypothetical protein|nr:DUF3071 domain-containing protein [Bifidobacteriaceae bacterium]